MTEARLEQAWNHTAALLALIVNVNRDPKKSRAARPADFHPVVQRNAQQAPPLKADLKILKTVFVDNVCPDRTVSS